MYDTATKLLQGSLTRGSHPTRIRGNKKFSHSRFSLLHWRWYVYKNST